MAKKPTKAVAKTKETLPAATEAMAIFEEQGMAGLENVTINDVVIPRLTILQDLSPQRKKDKPEYIDGAEEGMICDVSMGELLPSPVQVLPVHFVKQYLEWAPRASGKGLQGVHDTDACLNGCTPNEKGIPVNADGNLIIETAQFYLINLTAGGRRSFLPMSSSNWKHAKKWLSWSMDEKATRSDGSKFTPPIFYRTYNLDVGPESNAEGDWYGWRVSRGPLLTEMDNCDELIQDALAFREQVLNGLVRGDTAGMDGSSADSAAAKQADENMARM